MLFGSKQKRNSWTSSVLASVPDVLISIIAAYAMQSGLMGFFAVLVGLQVVYFLIWAKKAIWTWLLFWVRGRRQAAEHLLDYLRSNGYPEPDEYEDDVQDYLGKVMGNGQQPVDVRLKAAVELGGLNALRLGGQASLFLQTNLAFEDAIQRYKRTFPPKAYA